MSEAAAPSPDLRALQRRIVVVLSVGQVLSGVGLGAGVSLGALLVAAVSGDDALSGLAATAGTFGAAVFAIPLAALASRRGRRPALSLGALLAVAGATGVIGAASTGSVLLLLLALVVLGAGTAVNLQARFAATDLAAPRHRGRDLSIVVWTTTVGIVVGPNLVGPGQALGSWLSLPDLTGPFLITAGCQVAAAVLYAVALRPDPFLLATRARATLPARERRGMRAGLRSAGSRALAAIGIVALSQATMVSVMAMTPVHLTHHGATLAVIGLTISLHTLGMFGLSPVFGWLSDRVGRERVVLLGQGLFVASLLSGSLFADSGVAVTIAEAAIVAGATAVEDRPGVQGLSDTVMNLAGAIGGGLAGLVLAAIGYSGLNVAALVLVAAAVLLLLRGRLRATGARSPAPGR